MIFVYFALGCALGYAIGKIVAWTVMKAISLWGNSDPLKGIV